MLLKRVDFLLIIGPPVFLGSCCVYISSVTKLALCDSGDLMSHFNLYFSCVAVCGVNSVCILAPSFVQLL